jgi:hypothetical protein
VGAAVLAIDLGGLGERVDRDREASLVPVVAEDGPVALEEVEISRLCRGGRRSKHSQEQRRPGYETNPARSSARTDVAQANAITPSNPSASGAPYWTVFTSSKPGSWITR